MDNTFSKNLGEEKIEDVLKQVKKELEGSSLEKDPRGQEQANEELKNLKNVLLEADLQAGSVPVKKEANLSADHDEKKNVSFNENFLKLEKLIKDLKGRQ